MGEPGRVLGRSGLSCKDPDPSLMIRYQLLAGGLSGCVGWLFGNDDGAGEPVV